MFVTHCEQLMTFAQQLVRKFVCNRLGKTTHAQEAADKVVGFLSNVEFLRGAAEIVYSHHEKFDGTGYPRRLRGDDIPFGARVFMVVDTVDAMIYKRPYNTPVSSTKNVCHSPFTSWLKCLLRSLLVSHFINGS